MTITLPRQGAIMDHPVRLGLLFAASVLRGLLLLPNVPATGDGVLLMVCALILMGWVRRSSH